jgi:hypothetical protein
MLEKRTPSATPASAAPPLFLTGELSGMPLSKFELVADYIAEDRERGVRVKQTGDDIWGGDYLGPDGCRINWAIEYTSGPIKIIFPAYRAKAHYTRLHVGRVIDETVDRSYCIPRDIVLHLLRKRAEHLSLPAPTVAEETAMLHDVEEALQLMHRKRVEFARQFLGPDYRLEVRYFDFYRGGAVKFPVDWLAVGDRAVQCLETARG